MAATAAAAGGDTGGDAALGPVTVCTSGVAERWEEAQVRSGVESRYIPAEVTPCVAGKR